MLINAVFRHQHSVLAQGSIYSFLSDSRELVAVVAEGRKAELLDEVGFLIVLGLAVWGRAGFTSQSCA